MEKKRLTTSQSLGIVVPMSDNLLGEEEVMFMGTGTLEGIEKKFISISQSNHQRQQWQQAMGNFFSLSTSSEVVPLSKRNTKLGEFAQFHTDSRKISTRHNSRRDSIKVTFHRGQQIVDNTRSSVFLPTTTSSDTANIDSRHSKKIYNANDEDIVIKRHPFSLYATKQSNGQNSARNLSLSQSNQAAYSLSQLMQTQQNHPNTSRRISIKRPSRILHQPHSQTSPIKIQISPADLTSSRNMSIGSVQSTRRQSFVEYMTASKTNKGISLIKDALSSIDSNNQQQQQQQLQQFQKKAESPCNALNGEALENLAQFIASFVGLAAISLLNGGVTLATANSSSSLQAIEKLFIKYEISKQVLSSLPTSFAKETYIIKQISKSCADSLDSLIAKVNSRTLAATQQEQKANVKHEKEKKASRVGEFFSWVEIPCEYPALKNRVKQSLIDVLYNKERNFEELNAVHQKSQEEMKQSPLSVVSSRKSIAGQKHSFSIQTALVLQENQASFTKSKRNFKLKHHTVENMSPIFNRTSSATGSMQFNDSQLISSRKKCNENHSKDRDKVDSSFHKEEELAMSNFEEKLRQFQWDNEVERTFSYYKNCSMKSSVGHASYGIGLSSVIQRMGLEEKLDVYRESLIRRFRDEHRQISHEEKMFLINSSALLTANIDRDHFQQLFDLISSEDIAMLELKIADNILLKHATVNEQLKFMRNEYLIKHVTQQNKGIEVLQSQRSLGMNKIQEDKSANIKRRMFTALVERMRRFIITRSEQIKFFTNLRSNVFITHFIYQLKKAVEARRGGTPVCDMSFSEHIRGNSEFVKRNYPETAKKPIFTLHHRTFSQPVTATESKKMHHPTSQVLLGLNELWKVEDAKKNRQIKPVLSTSEKLQLIELKAQRNNNHHLKKNHSDVGDDLINQQSRFAFVNSGGPPNICPLQLVQRNYKMKQDACVRIQAFIRQKLAQLKLKRMLVDNREEEEVKVYQKLKKWKESKSLMFYLKEETKRVGLLKKQVFLARQTTVLSSSRITEGGSSSWPAQRVTDYTLQTQQSPITTKRESTGSGGGILFDTEEKNVSTFIGSSNETIHSELQLIQLQKEETAVTFQKKEMKLKVEELIDSIKKQRIKKLTAINSEDFEQTITRCPTRTASEYHSPSASSRQLLNSNQKQRQISNYSSKEDKEEIDLQQQNVQKKKTDGTTLKDSSQMSFLMKKQAIVAAIAIAASQKIKSIKKESDGTVTMNSTQSKQKEAILNNAQQKRKKDDLLVKQRRLFNVARNGTLQQLHTFGFLYTPNDLNRLDENKNTALFYAAKRGIEDLVMFLLQCGADPNQICSNGNTSLHVAFQCSSPTVIISLIEYNGDLNIPNNDGFTPLGFGQPQLLKELGLHKGITHLTEGQIKGLQNNNIFGNKQQILTQTMMPESLSNSAYLGLGRTTARSTPVTMKKKKDFVSPIEVEMAEKGQIEYNFSKPLSFCMSTAVSSKRRMMEKNNSTVPRVQSFFNPAG